MKRAFSLFCALLLAVMASGCSGASKPVETTVPTQTAGPVQKAGPAPYTDYRNDRGIGFFYPENGATLSGIAKVYGLAYTGEGWDETDKGVGSVVVDFGGKKQMDARTYVKDRYWIRTFDTAEFMDGPLTVTATAYDRKGALIGSAACTVTIDNSDSPVQRRLYAAPDGKSGNAGTEDSPWDLATGIDSMRPGDVLFLKGGVYTDGIVVQKSGTKGRPLTIMNVPGEKAELKGAGIQIGYKKEYIDIMGIDQSGLRTTASGAELAGGVKYIQFWDCSFDGNTYQYDQIPENTELSFGTGFLSEGTDVSSPEGNRQFITVSHCSSMYNDVDGFNFSSIDHGRFQFLEAAWNPDHKNADIFQYKHANGFVNKNSDYQGWGFASEDNAYLYCYAHDNGQDNWDIRSPHVWLYGCVSSDAAQAGHDYGGVGYKFWEYDYKVYDCISFRDNLVDNSGGGMLLACEGGVNGSYAFINNSVFYDTREFAVDARSGKNAYLKNNIFMDYKTCFTNPLPMVNTIFFKGAAPTTGKNTIAADPGFLNPDAGNFFLREGSPALSGGDLDGMTFVVDGLDYCKYDGLGRPRAGRNEIGPYTRYPGPDAAQYSAPPPQTASPQPAEGNAAQLADLEINAADITIDGNLDDWKDVPKLEFTTGTDGNKLQYVQDMSLAWDGAGKLYLRGTVREPEGRISNREGRDSANWWNDDVFEVFLTGKLPSSEDENRKTALHYALNSKYAFTAPDLQHSETVAIIPLQNNVWSFEMEIPLEGAQGEAVKAGDPIYAKFGVELNSAGEFSLLYRPEDGFWGVESYQKLIFLK